MILCTFFRDSGYILTIYEVNENGKPFENTKRQQMMIEINEDQYQILRSNFDKSKSGFRKPGTVEEFFNGFNDVDGGNLIYKEAQFKSRISGGVKTFDFS